ncbi:NUDIX hydrolase [Jongsikchunia kroppenstedtii]|uniref:NUDIX hydrolase n=1 Tax=Jongsikchunia kroppenstedtii TaxID=1121721 RepID=UPI000380665F
MGDSGSSDTSTTGSVAGGSPAGAAATGASDSPGPAPRTNGSDSGGPKPAGGRRNRRGRRGRRGRGGAAKPVDANGTSPTADSDAPSRQVKPSDLGRSAAVAKAGIEKVTEKAGTIGSGSGRKNGGRPADNGNRPRLRTVRETSAGGLVVSGLDAPDGERLAALIGRIDRRGRMMWSLPKGHIDTGETAEQTAVREVAEETGIEGSVVAPLGKIDYWFVSEGKRIHKTVHHYLMRSTGGELSDADHEVTEVAWVPITDLPRRLTYSDERRLARVAESVIADLSADPQRLAASEADAMRTEPNEYEKAAAARNQRRHDPAPPPRRRGRGRGRGRRNTSDDSRRGGDAASSSGNPSASV